MRTRFAPSPTGFLHVGGLRTALFSWLVAKQSTGTFFLRIEDTDQSREVAGAAESMIKDLAWAGLPPDEGVMLDKSATIIERGEYGPYFQSKRLELYKRYADQLLKDGNAYHCFCTAERLDEMRKAQQARKQAPMYDRKCIDLAKDETGRRIAAGEKYVIRMKVPRDETVTITDEIYGPMKFMGHTIDDQVLMKSDGFPTYHLAHVVDDHLMKTDIVIRGEEWLSSLPKHVLLFRYFGWQTPKFAHVPLLLNPDRTKLSKRQNDVATEQYIQKGYLPEVMVNFLALLGWNPGTTQEIFTMEELKEQFSLSRVQKSGAIFDLKKLDWLQGQWMRKLPLGDFVQRIQLLVAKKYKAAATDKDFAEKAKLIQERVTFFPEAVGMLGFFYERPNVDPSILINPKQGVTTDVLPKTMELLRKTLSAIDAKVWTVDNLKMSLEAVLEPHGLKRGQLLWPLRAALTGAPFSPGAYEVAAVLGKEETLARLTAVK